MLKDNKDAVLIGSVIFLVFAVGFFAYSFSGMYLIGNAVENDNALKMNDVATGFVIKTNNFSDTIGVYRSSTKAFFLRNSNNGGAPDIIINMKNIMTNQDVPIVGDWNGDKYYTIGFYRNNTSTFRLLSENSPDSSITTVSFGILGDVPVVGDWNGDGTDTIGVYRPSTKKVFLRNSNNGGAPDINFLVSIAKEGDVPVVGDWNGDGTDTIGLYRPNTSTFFLRNSNTDGGADLIVTFGVNGDVPVVGDWNGDGTDTIGVYRKRTGTFFLRNSNTLGALDVIVTFGINGDWPVVGDWKSIIVQIPSAITVDIPLGQPIADDNSTTFDKVYDSSKLRGLYKGTINFKGSNYKVREVLVSGQAPSTGGEAFVTVATSLTSSEEDYETGVFLESVRDSLKYYYIFDDEIRLGDIDDQNPLKINFLGKELTILKITGPNSFKVQISDPYKWYNLTVNDGDAYVGEDKDEPNWTWNIGNLNVVSQTTIKTNSEFLGPYIGVENDFVYDDASDNPPGIGDCIDLPNNYLSICFDSLNVADDQYATYTFELDTSADLDQAGLQDNMTGVSAIFIHTPVSEGLVLDVSNYADVNASTSSDIKTDKIWLYADNTTAINVFYLDTNNKVRLAGAVTAAAQGQFGHVNYGSTKDTDINMYMETEGVASGDDLNVTLVPYDSTNLPGRNDNITMKWTYGDISITKLGATASSEEAGEVQWLGLSTGVVNIGTKDEDHRGRYGIIIKNPILNGKKDSVVVDIPGSIVKANVTIKTGFATIGMNK